MPKVVNTGQKVLSHRSLEMVHQEDCRRHRRRKAEPQDGVDREPGGNIIKLIINDLLTRQDLGPIL